MTATRLDFIVISASIRNARLPVTDPAARAVDAARAQIAQDCAQRFEETNAQFDRDVFLKACGVVGARHYRGVAA